MHEKFINQNQLESELSALETSCAGTICAIINRCNDESNKDALICSSAEKESLLRLINNLYLRNPITMTEYSLDSPQPWILSLPSFQEMKSLLNTYNIGNVANRIISSVQKRVYLFENLLTTNINTHNLTFLVSKEKGFVFSNLPVFLRNTANNSCILFSPISPNCCVHYFENKNNQNYRKNKITYISKEQTIILNCLLGLAAQQDTKYLYAKDKQEIEDTIKNIGEFL